MSSDFFPTYDGLRHWYLARLRSLAFKRASHLTPATLMKADREVVERLMSESAVRQTSQDAAWLDLIKLQKAFQTLVWIMSAASGILFVFLLENKIVGAMILLFTLIFAFCVNMMAGRMFSKLSTTICEALGENPSTVADPLVAIKGAVSMSVQKERTIVDYAPEIVCGLGSSGEIQAINSTSDFFWGIPSYKLYNKPLADVLIFDDAHTFSRALELAKQGGQATFDCRVKCFNGSLMDMHFALEWSETTRLFYCVGRDVTAERELERVKREHIAMVSHDLRSPLTAIYGQIVLVTEGARGEVPEKIMSSMTSIKQNALRLLNLVNDILEIEKLESGLLELKCQWISSAKLANDALESVKVLAEARKVKLEYAGEDMQLYGDSDRLIQVIVNLVSNAIRFAPEGSTIYMGAEPHQGGGKVTVKDSGPGIKEDDRQKIFKRFEQVEQSGRGNTGLGLAICKGLVEKHGGTIGVDSVLGQGSTFWFRLPAGPVD